MPPISVAPSLKASTVKSAAWPAFSFAPSHTSPMVAAILSKADSAPLPNSVPIMLLNHSTVAFHAAVILSTMNFQAPFTQLTNVVIVERIPRKSASHAFFKMPT